MQLFLRGQRQLNYTLPCSAEELYPAHMEDHFMSLLHAHPALTERQFMVWLVLKAVDELKLLADGAGETCLAQIASALLHANVQELKGPADPIALLVIQHDDGAVDMRAFNESDDMERELAVLDQAA